MSEHVSKTIASHRAFSHHLPAEAVYINLKQETACVMKQQSCLLSSPRTNLRFVWPGTWNGLSRGNSVICVMATRWSHS